MSSSTAYRRHRLTLEQAEAEHTPKDQSPERLQEFPLLRKPFGFMNADWEALKAKMQPSDELWECSTSEESWAHLAGRQWIELVRGNETIGSILTAMN